MSDPRILLDPAVRRELSQAIPGFDRSGLLNALVDCWGGQDHLAKAIFLEFEHAARGSMVRQRTLDMICRMISQQANEQTTAPEQMSDDDLSRAILLAVPQLQKFTEGEK